MLANAGDTVRDGYIGYGLALAESITANANDAVWNCYASQTVTSMEGIIAYVGDIFRDICAGQIDAVIEGTTANVSNAIWDGYTG